MRARKQYVGVHAREQTARVGAEGGGKARGRWRHPRVLEGGGGAGDLRKSNDTTHRSMHEALVGLPHVEATDAGGVAASVSQLDQHTLFRKYKAISPCTCIRISCESYETVNPASIIVSHYE